MFSLIKWFIIGCLLLLVITACIAYLAVYWNAENVLTAISSGKLMSAPVVTHTESSYKFSDVLIYGFSIVGIYLIICICVGIYRGFNK